MKALTKGLALLLMGIATLSLSTSCKEDDNKKPKPTPTEQAALKGNITKDRTLDAKTAYSLQGSLIVKKGATLTIPAGTTITSKTGFDKYILVEQGAKIIVKGTASAPVTFTAEEKKPGAWGGLIINGYAPLTSSQKSAKTEINKEYPYGGDQPGDNSGSIEYLKLEYCGASQNDDVEHNSLTLNGVGNGTKLSNIFTYMGADDGVEFFGGTVNLDGFLAVNMDDDMFDVTQGWSGKLSNAYGIWEEGHVSTEKDPRGVEADGNHDGNYANDANQSNFTIENVTIVLNQTPSQEKGSFLNDVFKIRRGATAKITNALVKGQGQAENFINTTDKKGNGKLTITFNNQLTTPLTGKLIKSDNKDEVSYTEDPNLTGCDASIFGWTGYSFTETKTQNLSGNITKDMTLDAAVPYSLTGALFVKSGATLTIPAGTTITSKTGFDKYILVEQGGKIMVQGTAEAPVTFTAEKKEAGAWGGLIINGFAPLTSSQKTAKTEINSEYPYGGDKADDNSGSIEYLKLEYCGASQNDDVEHNSLTLNGVGSGTKIENVFAFKGADDGVEFFGGSVSVKNFLAVDMDDDMFDVSQGWNGTLTNAYGVWQDGHVSTEKDPRGVEADGNHDGNYPGDTHQSNFKMENITILLAQAPSQTKGQYANDVFKIRRGATATITNALVLGQGQAENFINTTDKKGNGKLTITYNNQLTTPVMGSEFKTGDKSELNAKEDKSLKGCDAGLFGWTGYLFPEVKTPEAKSESLKGDITGDKTLSAAVSYTIDGPVFVKKGASLTIPAGTILTAGQGFDKYILVEQGGKIFVKGTANKPVIMTSTKQEAGAWGGLIINGYAPLTSSQKSAKTEINNEYPYGGDKADDNSGSIEYLVLEYCGAAQNDDVEHNTLTLNGVGSGTKIENVFAYMGADDGVEFFGGAVSVKNFLAVDMDDDMFDVTQGWSGTLTNAYGIWRDGHVSTEKDPRGVEADGNHDGNYPGDSHQSNFVMENITIELAQASSQDKGKFVNDVFKIRRGATAKINNALVKGQGQAENFINTTDKKGDGKVTITYNNALETPVSGKLIKTNNDADVKATQDIKLKGCESSVFGWTKYDFEKHTYNRK